ncbi:MAG TPA: hypothetical protein VLM89_03050 [Phycisphaerae bacterium]|nr:hypothetical protein [Phycisphaerae bacterium]
MTSTLVSAEAPASARSPITLGFLIRFSGPLVATFLMMAAAAPIIVHGISWIKDAEGERVHLSAFLLVGAVAVFIYSPMFVSRDVANRTVTDRASFVRSTWFFMFWSAVAAVILLWVGQVDAVRHFVFGKVLHGTAETEHLAINGLRLFAVMPFLAALRGLGQGCHINNGETWHVGIGTALRLVAIAVFVYGFAVWHDMSGPVLGALTYLIGMTVETAYVLFTLRGKPQLTRIESGPTLTFRQFTRYAGPLMLGSFLLQFCPPMLIYIINRAGLPAENAAAFSVTRDCFWFVVSVLLIVPPLVVTHATSLRNLRLLLGLCVAVTAVLTALTGLLAMPAVRDEVFVRVFRVNNETILSLISVGLLWVLPTPALMFLNYLVAALHTRSGRTGWVTAGNLAGLLFLLAVAVGPDLSDNRGIVLAVVCNAVFLLVSTLVQAIGLFGGGFAAAIDPSSLAERLQNRHRPAAATAESVTRSAEIDRQRV